MNIHRKAKCEGSRVFANCFAQHFSGVILDEAAHSIIAQTSRQLHNEFRLGIEKQLFKIRLNLQKEWYWFSWFLSSSEL